MRLIIDALHTPWLAGGAVQQRGKSIHVCSCVHLHFVYTWIGAVCAFISCDYFWNRMMQCECLAGIHWFNREGLKKKREPSEMGAVWQERFSTAKAKAGEGDGETSPKKKEPSPNLETCSCLRLSFSFFSPCLLTWPSPLCVGPDGLQRAGRRRACSPPHTLSLSWEHMTESIEQSSSSFPESNSPGCQGPAKPAPCYPFFHCLHQTIYDQQRDRQNIY